MTIDDLLGKRHDDKLLTIEERLSAIDLELNRRRLISQETTVRLFEQLHILNDEIQRLRPEGHHSLDPNVGRRAPLEREHRERERDLTEELANRWRDERDLRKEQRELVRERREELQRYQRHLADYDT